MKRAIIKVHRIWQDENQTSGNCTVLIDNFPVFASLSLERGWQNNKRNVSCYPAGIYIVKLEWSEKFSQKLWEVKGVPNRSECKFHSASHWFDLNGCTSLGLDYYSDFNKDGYRDLKKSRLTMDSFHKALEGYKEAVLIITAEPNVH